MNAILLEFVREETSISALSLKVIDSKVSTDGDGEIFLMLTKFTEEMRYLYNSLYCC